jgi:hypothetical protein
VKISISFGKDNLNAIEISILRRKRNRNNHIQNLTGDRDDVFWAFRAFVGCCWMSISCGFLNNWVSLGVGVRAQKLMVMMCLGILAYLAVLGCYNINSGHDDGDTQIEHVSWDSASQQNFSPRLVPTQVLMMPSGADPEYWVDVVVGHGSWVICARRVCIRCARVSRKSSVLSWVVGRWVRCRNCMFNCYDVWAFVCPALFVVLFVVSRKLLVVEYVVGLRSLIVNASGLACESSIVGCCECLPSSVVFRSRVGQ